MTDDDTRQISKAELATMSGDAINKARHAGQLDDIRAGFANDPTDVSTWGPALMRQVITEWWITEADDQ